MKMGTTLLAGAAAGANLDSSSGALSEFQAIALIFACVVLFIAVASLPFQK